MKKVIILNKKEGETPLFALEKFRAKHSAYSDLPMTYAGRLDPMASGVLVVLAGPETKNKQKYLDLDKEYEVNVLFGFSTDTYDILGKVAEFAEIDLSQNFSRNLKNNLKLFKGKLLQKYPVYSSKAVNGKPLFEYARSGEGVELPEREIFIKKIILQKISKISGKTLLKNIKIRINKVQGDFRQKEIVETWEKELENKTKTTYFVAGLKVSCKSGAYMRWLANSLGEKMGAPALALKIVRTKVGKYKI